MVYDRMLLTNAKRRSKNSHPHDRSADNSNIDAIGSVDWLEEFQNRSIVAVCRGSSLFCRVSEVKDIAALDSRKSNFELI